MQSLSQLFISPRIHALLVVTFNAGSGHGHEFYLGQWVVSKHDAGRSSKTACTLELALLMFLEPFPATTEHIWTILLDNERHVAYLPCHPSQQPANQYTCKWGQSRCACPQPTQSTNCKIVREPLKSAESGLD